MEPLNHIQHTILTLLRSSFWGEHCTFSPETNWTEVWQELRIQTVDGLVIEQLIQQDSTRKGMYLQTISKKLSFWYTLMSVQQEVCTLLQKHDIPCAVLKGSAAAIYYSQPTYRTMGDIDLIVHPEQYKTANNILKNAGYEHLDADNFRHSIWRHQGVLVELHRCFSVIRSDIISHPLDQFIYHGLGHVKGTMLEGFSFPLLPKLENGLVLLYHISQHMEHGLGLRQIIDWMFYVNKELDDSFWHSEFQAVAKELGLDTLAVTVTKMCQMYLGLRKSLTWCKDAEENLCHDLMVYILAQGNFGRKKGVEHNHVIVILNSIQTIPALFKRLQSRGLRNWETAQKHAYLKPFAWIYQGSRYAIRGLKREQAFQSLWTDAKESRQKDLFLNQLGVVRYGREFLSEPKKDIRS